MAIRKCCAMCIFHSSDHSIGRDYCSYVKDGKEHWEVIHGPEFYGKNCPMFHLRYTEEELRDRGLEDYIEEEA